MELKSLASMDGEMRNEIVVPPTSVSNLLTALWLGDGDAIDSVKRLFGVYLFFGSFTQKRHSFNALKLTHFIRIKKFFTFFRFGISSLNSHIQLVYHEILY